MDELKTAFDRINKMKEKLSSFSWEMTQSLSCRTLVEIIKEIKIEHVLGNKFLFMIAQI